MPTPRRLNEAIYTTLHRSKKELAEIADDCGVSANSLYRYSSPEESNSFAALPLQRVLPILNSTNNDAILDFLEMKRGRIAFKIPRVACSKLNDSEIVEHYQNVTIDAVKALRQFLSKPNKKNLRSVEDALIEVMQESASVKKYVAKKASGQGDLFYE